MTEPITAAAGSASLAVVAVALLGPLAGPYTVIVFAALAGSLWPLSAAHTLTRSAGSWLVLRCTTLAVVLTSGVSEYLSSAHGIAPGDSLAPVALFIGAMGNGWRPVFSSLSDGVALAAARIFRRADEQGGAK